jgi:RNA polymerase sigma-70 factor (ECF subfamily)
VHQALERLSNAQRNVFVLRHYEGLQLAEIAEVLECSIGSVKVHLFRAVRKLRLELKDIGHF